MPGFHSVVNFLASLGPALSSKDSVKNPSVLRYVQCLISSKSGIFKSLSASLEYVTRKSPLKSFERIPNDFISTPTRERDPGQQLQRLARRQLKRRLGFLYFQFDVQTLRQGQILTNSAQGSHIRAPYYSALGIPWAEHKPDVRD